jgi:hypothetical protein
MEASVCNPPLWLEESVNQACYVRSKIFQFHVYQILNNWRRVKYFRIINNKSAVRNGDPREGDFIYGDGRAWAPLWSSGQSSWLQNGDVLCFLWGTNWIYVCYAEESRQPLWSSGQTSWLQNRNVLCFLWGMNWIYICYVEESRPPVV